MHLFGKAHLATDPLRALQVARNITVGLERVAPERSRGLERGIGTRRRRTSIGSSSETGWWSSRAEIYSNSSRSKAPLMPSWRVKSSRAVRSSPSWGVGWAWRKPLRGRDIICYHKNWAYLEARFGERCADFVEAKPENPSDPGTRGLASPADDKLEGIGVILAASDYDERTVETVARRGMARSVVVSMNPSGRAGVRRLLRTGGHMGGNGLARAFAGSGG